MTVEEALENTPERRIAGVKLMLDNPLTEGKVLIIIEGDDDKKVYDRLFNENTTTLYPVGGCGKYNDILDSLNNDYADRLIAIKDSDFDRLNNEDSTIVYDNLFITDGHDAEMMIADSNFERTIQNEYLDGARESIITKVEKDIYHLSYIKWFNSVERKGINVEIFKPDRGIYDGNSEISISDCIQRIETDKRNDDIEKIEEQLIVDFESNHSNVDLRELTNGHDLIEGISRKLYYENAIKAERKGKKPNIEELGRVIRSTYSPMQFQKTELYRNIKKWEENNNWRILIS